MKWFSLLILFYSIVAFGLSEQNYEKKRQQFLNALYVKKNPSESEDNPFPQIKFTFSSSIQKHLMPLSNPFFHLLYDTKAHAARLSFYKWERSLIKTSENSAEEVSYRYLYRKRKKNVKKKIFVDLRVPFAHQAFPDDYTYERYSRGHLVPSRISENFCDVTTNMAPQLVTLNSKEWQEIEYLPDYLSSLVENRPIYVVTGTSLFVSPSFLGYPDSFVEIPRYFYKVLFIPQEDRCYIGMAFLMENTDSYDRLRPMALRSLEGYQVDFQTLTEKGEVTFFQEFLQISLPPIPFRDFQGKLSLLKRTLFCPVD